MQCILTKPTSPSLNRMPGSGARHRALPSTPMPSPPPRAPPVSRHPQVPGPPPTRHPRDPRPQQPRSPGMPSAIPPSSLGAPGSTFVLPPPSSSSSSSRPRQAHSRKPRTNRHSSPHQMSPINAANPALTFIYNCMIFFCCCLPDPKGRVVVGLGPRISSGETPGERRKRERKEQWKKREEEEQWKRGLEVKSSPTGVSSGEERKSGGGEGQERGRPEKAESVSGVGSPITGSSASSGWGSSLGSTGSGSSSSSRSSSGSSSSGSSSDSSSTPRSSSETGSRKKVDSQVSASGSSSSGVPLALEGVPLAESISPSVPLALEGVPLARTAARIRRREERRSPEASALGQ